MPTPERELARETTRRARRSFWVLTAMAIAATGSLSGAVGAPPSPATGLWFVASALVLVVSLGLALRVMSALARAGASPQGSTTMPRRRALVAGRSRRTEAGRG